MTNRPSTTPPVNDYAASYAVTPVPTEIRDILHKLRKYVDIVMERANSPHDGRRYIQTTFNLDELELLEAAVRKYGYGNDRYEPELVSLFDDINMTHQRQMARIRLLTQELQARGLPVPPLTSVLASRRA